jgi:hypothetical protein
MMLTRSSDHRVFGRRSWCGVLSVVAVLGSLALVAPATSAAKKPASATVTVDPSCAFVSVAGTWNPVPGQSYVGAVLTDNQTGDSYTSVPIPVAATDTSNAVDISGLFTPATHGQHALKAVFVVYDADFNALESAKASTSMACVLTPVVLPT